MKLFKAALCKQGILKYNQLWLQKTILGTSNQSQDNYSSKNFLNMEHKEKEIGCDISDISWYSKLLEPYIYICKFHQQPDEQKPKKMIRAFNYWLQIQSDKLLAIEEIVEKLQSATLLIEDTQDDSKRGRDILAAHSLYSARHTFNTSILMLFFLINNVWNLNHPYVIPVCMNSLLDLYTGKGIELYWRDNYICPTEADYKEVAVLKNGEILMIIGLMKLFSKHKGDFGKLITILGIYIQILNDYNSLFVPEYMENKGCYFEDLTEGKFSFPIIHAIQSHPDDKRIIHILRQRTNDPELKKYCVSLLESFGSAEYTKKILIELYLKAKNEISKLGANPLLESFLDELCDWKIK